jgi:hypothetical protein
VIDGVSLFDATNAQEFDHCGVLDCEHRDRNVEVVADLLLEKHRCVLEGRHQIFVCPECDDIGCGSITCEIVRDGDEIVWRRFAYQKDYLPEEDDFESYAAFGPYRFAWAKYKQVLETTL